MPGRTSYGLRAASLVWLGLGLGCGGQTAMMQLDMAGPASDLTGADLIGVVVDATGGVDAASSTSAPLLVASSPSAGENQVPLSAPISLTFSRPMDTTSTGLMLAPATTVGAGVWSMGDTMVTFQPSSALTASSSYTVTVHGQDKTAKPLATTSFSFGTIAAQDVTPPTIVSTIPSAGAVDVDPTTRISVKFSEEMDPSTVTFAISTTIAGIAQVQPTLFPIWSEGFTRVTLTNPPSLIEAGTYSIVVSGKDLAGNLLTGGTFGFSVYIAPRIQGRDSNGFGFTYFPSISPVSLAAQVALFFTKPMDQTSTDAAISIIDQGTSGTGSTPVTCVCTGTNCPASGWIWNVDNQPNPHGANYVSCGVFLNPGNKGAASPAFQRSHFYQVTITSAAKDTTNHPLQFDNSATSFSWQFKIMDAAPATDTTAPTVLSISPAFTAVAQSANPPVPIVITFSEPMDITSTQAAFTVSPNAGGALKWSSNNTVLTYTPPGAWPYATTTADNITFSVGTGAKDSGGYPTLNPLAAAATGSFRTVYGKKATLPVYTSGNAVGYVYSEVFIPSNPITGCGVPSQVNVGLDVAAGAFSNAECDPILGLIVKEEAARGFLTFDVSSLKTVLKVTSATIDLNIGEVDGNPGDLGMFSAVDVWTPSAGDLMSSSYAVAPSGSAVSVLPTPTTPGVKYGADVTAVVAEGLQNRGSQMNRLQLRLQWSNNTTGNPFQNTGYKIHSSATNLNLQYESDSP